MGDYQITGSYQGLDVLACAVTRKPGLTPDQAWIEVGTEQLQGFDIVDTFRLWGAAQIQEPPGPLSAGAASQFSGGPGHATVVSQTPSGGQLLRCASLTFQTTIDGQAAPNGDISLDFMFLDPSGLEELIEDLRDALDHNVGRVRIHLTDFRHYWADYGSPCYGRYNFVNEDGSHDPKTLNKDTQKAWKATDLFTMVALALPGSPDIHESSDIFTEDLNDPVNLHMKMELPSTWMKRLLELYEMELHLTGDYQLYIVKKNTPITVRAFPTFDDVLGSSPISDLPDSPTSEKITVYINDSPEAVYVAGGIRQVRNTEQCVPAFIDEFNQVQRLEDVGDVWGYSLSQAKKQRLIHPSKSYGDIPASDAAQKRKRIEIARKHFFRTYAPASLFREPTDNDFPQGDPAPVVAWPTERERHPLLPMKHPWYTPAEVSSYFSQSTAVQSPQDPEVSVDLIRMPFIVYAFQIKQDYSDRLDQVQASINAHLTSCDDYQNLCVNQITVILKQLQELGVVPTNVKQHIWDKLGALSKAKAILNQAGDQFLSNATSFLEGLGLPQATQGSAADQVNKALQAEADANAYKDQRITQLEGQIEILINASIQTAEAQAEIQSNLQAVTKAIQNWKYAKLWINTPYQLVHHGDFQVIPEKGLIHFHEIAGSMNFGAVYDTEDADFINDGNVQITWMSDKITGDPSEMSSWVFLRNKQDGGQPTLVRICEPSPAKPFLINDESLVLAENEKGDSMNADQVTEKAARLAAGPLSSPRKQTGYTWTYPGFWAVQTDGGYNSVSWIMKVDENTGDVTAHTIIRAGNPDDTSFGMASVSRKKHQERLLYGDWDGPGKRHSRDAY